MVDVVFYLNLVWEFLMGVSFIESFFVFVLLLESRLVLEREITVFKVYV